MSRKRQLFKAIQKNFRQISKQFISAINKQIILLLRTISGTRRRGGSENAGFLLPTVSMVLIVVVLLTTAILFRSFERSKNASNVRVNQAVLNAAAPALDRARAKLDKLFNDSRLPRAVPSDKVLEDTLSSTANLPEFTFGDETPLKLHYAYTTAPTGENQPQDLTTAWMFPTDTNNNGKFDSYTLYGIYLRTPLITSGTYSRPRNPLEARTPPMTSGSLSNSCKNSVATSAALVGSTGWVSIAGQLQKSFFVYTANVPITNPLATGNYEAFKGNKGFSSLEYQQDRVQLPLVNNAVVYNDDIELTPGTTFNLNGRMRATAVYHYQASGYSATSPKPIACISSFYDPTNSTTAKNLAALPYNGNTGGNSHNGIVYAAPTKGVSDYLALLKYQANLMYPNGRLVNPTLNTAMGLVAASGTLTISQQSAIDASICAIQILDGSIGAPSTSVIPHGAIYETAFLDARQIKAIHKDVSTAGVETFTNADGVNGNGTGTSTLCYFQYTCTINATGTVASPSTDYELAKETRQPLEIRATVLDINKLRTTTYGTATPQEYLIPNSGIIYATRDDALRDLSYPAGITATDTATQRQTKQDTQKSQSPVDYKLDPTRRPNAIMLINGNPILRVQAYRDAEKGLVLASNLPVYILGNFNIHTQQEFNTTLASDLGNFYSRGATSSDFNPNFACRTGDPRLPNCTTGDAWRPVSVLSDAITLLSNNFVRGYRSDGDYDLNNNLGDNTSITAFINNGFNTNNANVINAAWYGSDGLPKDLDSTLPGTQGSSYLNNFVTSIQRRKSAPEYLMEVCPKLPVSACDSGTDWYVTVLADGGLKASNVIGQTFVLNTHLAGTTAQAQLPTGSHPEYLGYPRRVAFLRNASGELTLTSGQPTIIGIKGGKITSFPLSTFSSSNKPDDTNNSLWFRSSNSNTNPPIVSPPPPTATATTQPALSPVLQIQVAFSTSDENVPPSGSNNLMGPGNQQGSYWMQWATATTFNLAAAGADTPARPTEDNGGLHNFVRFLENWSPTSSTAIAATITGSFIQRTRSAYATAPFVTYLTTSSLDPYPIANGSGLLPFYVPPNRQWGYDVALLSQSPDAFSQKLAITPNNKPNEYFREVGRDDTWVQTLLCAKKASDSSYAIDADQRPSCS
ncbi:MAG: hormogonium polysaccharide biosynthesis protein HpsA [Nostoc sp.]|uniref:hormogonium polysaccharide biosynthesis protein HpsA n=1 Tax=Nostoc sp. TaxID=1180 RepID=UPI002FF3AE0F